MEKFKKLVAMKIETLPSWDDAKCWSQFRLSKPMTQKEYNEYVDMDMSDAADNLRNLCARTTLAWYSDKWLNWFCFWDVSEYEYNIAASNSWED